MSATPKSSWPWVRALLHSVYDQPDAASVGAQFDRVLDAVPTSCPRSPNTSTPPAPTYSRLLRFPRSCDARSGRTTHEVTIPVPKLLRQRDTEAYLSLLILRYYCTGDELDRLVSRCRAIGRSSDRELVSLADLEELTSRFGTSVGGHLSIASILAQQIYIPLEGNPRRVKRFLNALFLRERALIAQETPFALVFIAYWMVLEVCHPHQFEVLVSLFHDIDADADEMLRLLQECKTSGVLPGQQNDDSLVIQAWLEMVPARMVEETILPYLPVAASLRRTQPTISGPSRGPSRVADPSRGPSRVADPFDPPAPRPPSHPPLIDRGHSMEPPRPAAAGPHDNKPSIDGRPPGTAPVPPLDPKPFPPDARSSTPPSLS
jgi:hypothetical protein